MSGMSPTPGPWRADGYYVRGRHGRMIADVCYTGPRDTPPEEYPAACRLADEANARLIAAAPDMADERRRLRAVFPAMLESLGSGWCSADCSVEFIEMIPAEVRAVIAQRDALIDALITALEKINDLASDSTDSDVWAAMESIGEISHNAITK